MDAIVITRIVASNAANPKILWHTTTLSNTQQHSFPATWTKRDLKKREGECGDVNVKNRTRKSLTRDVSSCDLGFDLAALSSTKKFFSAIITHGGGQQYNEVGWQRGQKQIHRVQRGKEEDIYRNEAGLYKHHSRRRRSATHNCHWFQKDTKIHCPEMRLRSSLQSKGMCVSARQAYCGDSAL